MKRTAVFLAAAIALAGCGGDGDTGGTEASVPGSGGVAGAVDRVSSDETTTSAASTTTSTSTTSTTTTTTPRTTVPPPTVDPVELADSAVSASISSVNTSKTEFADIIKSLSSSIDTVDLIDVPVDGSTATLTLGVTSGYNTVEYRDEVAWSVARGLASLWDADGGFRNDVGNLRTGLRLTIDSTVYVASYDQMVSIAEMGTTSGDWLAQTRQ